MIDPRIERMIEETRQQASLTPASTRDLREAIESSPFLSDLMVNAIEADSLRNEPKILRMQPHTLPKSTRGAPTVRRYRRWVT